MPEKKVKQTPDRSESRINSGQNLERQAKLSKTLSWKERLALGVATAIITVVSFIGIGQLVKPKDQKSRIDSFSLLSELVNLNEVIIGNPETSENSLRRVVNLGLEYFCEDAECQPEELERLKSSYILQKKIEYFETMQQFDTCIDSDPPYEATAYGDPLSGKMYFNVDILVYDQESGSVRKRVSDFTLATTFHEAGHSRPPIKVLDNGQRAPYLITETELPTAFVHGVQRAFYRPEKSKPGKRCFDIYRKYLEEAVVEQNSKKLMRQLGLEPHRTIFDQAVQNYQFILDRYFEGDNRGLFRHHQKSQDANFVGNIGLRLGFPKEQAVLEGDKFLAGYFDPIRK